jgi:hypothetical protein
MFAELTFNVAGILPAWLVWVLAGGLLGVLAHGTLVLIHKKIQPRWVAILGGLRLAIALVFLLILLQPVLSFSQTTEQLPEIMVLVDTSASMGKPGGASQGSRLDESITALRKSELVAGLGKHYQLHWFRFDTTAQPMTEADLPGLKAAGASTRYAESLTAAWNQLRALGKAPERALLISDGNDLGKTDPAETARSLGLVIDTLAPTSAPAGPPGQVAIVDVQSSRRVLLGSETHFRVRLAREAAGPELTVPLRLTEDGKKVWDQEVSLKAGQSERVVITAHRPASSGTKKYVFQIGPKPAGEASSPSGSSYETSVQVLDSKYEVLILEDSWRWEFKYLRRLFEDDPSFRFTALLPRTGGSFVQFGSHDRRVNLVGFPQGRAELEGFDTFVLGDVDPSRWPRRLPAALARLVTEEGKSLVVVAGPNLTALAAFPELHALLPVELATDSAKPVTGPVEVHIRPDSSNSPFFFQIRGEAKLPPLDQIYPPLRKRPAATVLLETAKQANSYGKLIVIAEHTVGRGRVLFIGADTLWKWRTLAPAGPGPTPYSLFWQQAFRALTPARSNLGGVQLWLQTNRTRGEVGRPLVVEAEVQSVRPLPYPKIQATVELPDQRQLSLAFAADPANPLRFRAEFEPILAGPHTVKAGLISEGKSLAETSVVVHVDAARGEDNDHGIDRTNLERLAAATGGKAIDPNRPETWPSPAGHPLPQVTQSRTVDLWSNFTLFLILCGLLGTDWFLRLMKGYV